MSSKRKKPMKLEEEQAILTPLSGRLKMTRRRFNGYQKESHIRKPLSSFFVGLLPFFSLLLGSGLLANEDGPNWTKVDVGLTPVYPGLSGSSLNGFFGLIVSGTNLFAGWASELITSADSGTSWKMTGQRTVDNVSERLQCRCLLASGPNLYAGTTGDGIWISTDDGRNWSELGPGLPLYSNINGLAMFGPNLFAAVYTLMSDEGFYILTNKSKRWRPITSGLSRKSRHRVEDMPSAVSAYSCFIGTPDGVYRSVSNGLAWTPVNAGLSTKESRDVHALAVIGETLFAGTWGEGVFRSEDKGLSWTAVNSGLTDRHVKSFAVSVSNLFAGTEQGGVFLSQDHGATWSALGLRGQVIDTLVASGPYLLASVDPWNGGGLWRATLSDLNLKK